MLRLGSAYGGWCFADLPDLVGGTVLSCGLGEDASFDVEMARTFGASIVIVDPTPRAIAHFSELIARIGLPAEAPYATGGRQPVTAYDLRGLRREQFRLIPKALAEVSGPVRFYAPKNSDDVSYSIVNFQNNYERNTPFIEVEGVDVNSLISEEVPRPIALAKFDVEGAEIIVLPELLNSGVRPHQILVEYDELNWPSAASRNKFYGVHERLTTVGYLVADFDGRSCVAYVLPFG